ncbi:hypothetical protein [Streptomyces sp. NPDC001980]|uniref:hypothetical protein n=1 Tax=Streptomyces sp. NPDC001980 TaxID=3157126 RepID=UPI003333F839
MSTERELPAVAPAVTAELVAALSPRLRRRLDAGIAKLADRPVVRDGDTVRVTVDDEGSELELHAPGGVVADAAAIRCGCLLAPDCLHRAAAASAAPVADMAEAAGRTESGSAGAASTGTAQSAEGAVSTGGAETAEQPTSLSGSGEASVPDQSATPPQRSAAHAVFDAVAAVLDAGTDGSGAVLQAELLRAAHTARLAGLPRAAAAAVSVVTALRAARAADPAFRLAELVSAVSEALSVAHRVPYAMGAELAGLRGTVRQPYTPDGSLRLYGLFSEPVLTASGYAGAVTWTGDAEGRLYTVSDVAPGGAGRAVGAADRAVRIGDTALTHRELARAGLAVSGATVSPTGRLGAGAGVRAVRASGADWRAEPLDRLWAVPVAEQVGRALGGGHDLLFLEVTLVGAVREAAGDCLLADCGGVPLRLTAAHDHPALPHRDNLRLLAAARGSRLRVIARLTAAPHARAQLLATEHPKSAGSRIDLGLDRLQHADLPAPASPHPPSSPPSAPAPAPSPSAPIDAVLAPDEAPLHLLRRRIEQAAAGGRRVLAFPGDSAADARRLHRHGLGTAGDILDELLAAAAERSRDAFGRLLPADTGRFARAWLAAGRYTEEVDRVLCAAAWGG